MQLEVWEDTYGNLTLLLPDQDSRDGWKLIGYVNVVPAEPVLSTMEIHDDRTDTQGSDPTD